MEQPPQVTAETVRAWDRPLVIYSLFVLISLVGGLFPSFSPMAYLLVLAIGGTMTWLGLSGRIAKRSPLTRVPRAAAWWLVPMLLLALVELFAFTKHSITNYPTLSLLADPVLDQYAARAACYFGWLAAFWGLIKR